jgi:hypothetical protein
MHESALETAENTPFNEVAPDFSGRWVNQMSSVMDLQVSGSDVTGKYNSASSGNPGGDPIEGILKGYVAGDLISFMVLWPRGSMTSWVGQLVEIEGVSTIKTLWHLLTEVPDAKEPRFLWQSIFSGADEFKR